MSIKWAWNVDRYVKTDITSDISTTRAHDANAFTIIATLYQ